MKWRAKLRRLDWEVDPDDVIEQAVGGLLTALVIWIISQAYRNYTRRSLPGEEFTRDT